MLIEAQELMVSPPQVIFDCRFSLADPRAGRARYDEGHIPGAISIYDAQFEKNLDKLPKDKDNLLVFYCGGPT